MQNKFCICSCHISKNVSVPVKCLLLLITVLIQFLVHFIMMQETSETFYDSEGISSLVLRFKLKYKFKLEYCRTWIDSYLHNCILHDYQWCEHARNRHKISNTHCYIQQLYYSYPTQVQYVLLLLPCIHQNYICIQAKQLTELSTVTCCRCA